MPERPQPEDDTPGFEHVGDVAVPSREDADREKVKERIIKKIDTQRTEEEVRKQMGVSEKPPTPVPRDVPKFIFNFLSRLTDCEKMKTTPEENEILARHLTVIFGKMDSKLWSLLIIMIVVISKAWGCIDAIKAKMSLMKKPVKKEEPKETLPPVIA